MNDKQKQNRFMKNAGMIFVQIFVLNLKLVSQASTKFY